MCDPWPRVFVWLRQADPTSLWGRRMWHVPGELWTRNQTSLQQPLVSNRTDTDRTQNPCWFSWFILEFQIHSPHHMMSLSLSLSAGRQTPTSPVLPQFVFTLMTWWVLKNPHTVHTLSDLTGLYYIEIQFSHTLCVVSSYCTRICVVHNGSCVRTVAQLRQ